MEIDKYLQEQLNLITDNSNNEYLMLLSYQICGNLSYQYNYNGDISNLVQKVYQILVNYQSKSVNLNDTIALLHNEIGSVININNTVSYSSYSNSSSSYNSKRTSTNGNKKSSKKNDSASKTNKEGNKPNEESKTEEPAAIKITPSSVSLTNTIIDSDIDIINQIVQKYINAQEIASDTAVNIENPTQEPEIEEIKNMVTGLATELNEEFCAVASSLTDTWDRLTAVDDSIPDLNDSTGRIFDAFLTGTESWKSSKKLHKAKIDFFAQHGCKIDGDNAIYEDDKIEYTFDVKKSSLSVRDKKTGVVSSVKVDYLIPEGTANYGNLSTVTYIVSDQFKTDNQSFSSDAILILPVYNEKKHKDNKSLMINDFSNATEFINKVVGTDVKKNKNTVMGSSKYGALALQTAAKSDTYNAVVCVNNALIVMDENGVSAGKEKFSNYDDVYGLDGKDIYFISTSNDPNTEKMGKGSNCWMDCKDIRDSYFYTGIKLLLEKCPNAHVHVITNSKEENAFLELARKYSNYDYSPDYWNKFYLGNYHGHNDYGKVVKNIVSSSLLI